MVRGYAEPKIVFGLDYLQMWKLETISLWHFRARRLLRRNPFSIHERDQAYLLDVDNFVFDKQVIPAAHRVYCDRNATVVDKSKPKTRIGLTRQGFPAIHFDELDVGEWLFTVNRESDALGLGARSYLCRREHNAAQKSDSYGHVSQTHTGMGTLLQSPCPDLSAQLAKSGDFTNYAAALVGTGVLSVIAI